MYLTTFKICHKIYGLDPTRLLNAAELAWQMASKKTNVKIDLLTDIMLSTV